MALNARAANRGCSCLLSRMPVCNANIHALTKVLQSKAAAIEPG
jgi:hypothetical protein